MEGVTTTTTAEVNNNQAKETEARTGLLVTEPEQWLCVAKLPRDTTEQEFHDILAEFGKVADSFLMVSDKTGLTKGYGFARFHSACAALQARHVLEGQEVRGHLVACEWVKEGNHPLATLHSKVLYVDQLPEGFRDLPQFRKLFASVVTPPYCQIAQKHGVLQSWGLVEYNTPAEAEATMEAIAEATFDGQKVRVQYCVPNIHAINIYMSFVNNPLDKRTEKKALLDEGPSKDVYHQLEQLSKQNPMFVQSLQSIMTASHCKEPGLAATPQTPAVLALLLASHLQPGTSSLTSLAKKLEGGTSPVDLLQQALSRAPQAPSSTGAPKADGQPPLLPSPPTDRPATSVPDLMGLISRMTAVVAPAVTPSTKSPQLQNMLYSAFQARRVQQEEPGGPGEDRGQAPGHPGQLPTPPCPGQPTSPPSFPGQPSPTFTAQPTSTAPSTPTSPAPAFTSPTPTYTSPASTYTSPPTNPSPYHQPSPAPPYSHPTPAPAYSQPSPAPLYPGHPAYTSPATAYSLQYAMMAPYYPGPPPHLPPTSSPTALTQMLSQPPPPPPPQAHLAPDHSWPPYLLQPPLQPPLLAPPPALWQGQATLCSPPPAGLKRKGEEYLGYPDLDPAALKRQKLCGN